MNIRTKILIDRIAGTPLLAVLNAALSLVPARKRPASFRTIIVCKLIGMGSIIQAGALLQSLRLSYPHARIVFLTTKSNESLLSHMAMVDEALTIDDRTVAALLSTTLRALFTIRARRFDLFLDLEVYARFASILAALSGARQRDGFFKGSPNHGRGIYSHLVYFNIKAPIKDAYLQLARVAGCKELSAAIPGLAIVPRDRSAIADVLRSRGCGPQRRIVVVNPNASGLRIERRWKHANFTDLITRVIKRFPGRTIILTGSPSERGHVAKIFTGIEQPLRDSVLDLSGLLSTGELIALIEVCELLITNDTGPMHIAAAIGTKTVALFGPCAPEQYGVAENVVPFYKNVYCSPCVHEFEVPPCNGNNHCMQAIGVDEVFDAVASILMGGNLPRELRTPIRYTATDGSSPLGLVNGKR